jgi:hypothetical protein
MKFKKGDIVQVKPYVDGINLIHNNSVAYKQFVGEFGLIKGVYEDFGTFIEYNVKFSDDVLERVRYRIIGNLPEEFKPINNNLWSVHKLKSDFNGFPDFCLKNEEEIFNELLENPNLLNKYDYPEKIIKRFEEQTDYGKLSDKEKDDIKDIYGIL